MSENFTKLNFKVILAWEVSSDGWIASISCEVGWGCCKFAYYLDGDHPTWEKCHFETTKLGSYLRIPDGRNPMKPPWKNGIWYSPCEAAPRISLNQTVCSVGKILLGGSSNLCDTPSYVGYNLKLMDFTNPNIDTPNYCRIRGIREISGRFWKNPRISTGRVGLQKEAVSITSLLHQPDDSYAIKLSSLDYGESHMNFHLEKPQCRYKQRQIGCTVTICGYIYEMSGHLWRNSIPITTWAWGLPWCPEVYVHEGNKKLKSHCN